MVDETQPLLTGVGGGNPYGDSIAEEELEADVRFVRDGLGERQGGARKVVDFDPEGDEDNPLDVCVFLYCSKCSQFVFYFPISAEGELWGPL